MRTQSICLALGISLLSVHARSQWVQTDGPCGGPVRRLAISGTSLFAGTRSGVFRSTNNGQRWTDVGLTGCLMMELFNAGTNVLAGTAYDGLFLSTDDGTTWMPANDGLPRTSWDSTRWTAVRCLASSDTKIFAGIDEEGIVLSTNGGTSWVRPANDGLSGRSVLTLAVSGTNVFAGTYGGVFLSTNNGASWSSSSLDLHISALAVNGMDLFAGTPGGVYHSTDNGGSWSAVNEGLPKAGYDTMRVVSINCFASSGTNLFVGTEAGVFLSTNHGTTWSEVNTGLPRPYANALLVSGTNVFAGTDDGVFLSSTMGTNWHEVSYGLTRTFVAALAASGSMLFAGELCTGAG